MDRVTLMTGDCLHIMPTLAAESFDSLVTDPPYGLGFMGKDWDHGVPGVAFWQAALRVAKPGAHLLAFGGTRTNHRLACAIEDAGWEIRDTIMWVYGSGFPKSLDVSKAIDKAAGAEREVVGMKPNVHSMGSMQMHEGYHRPWMDEPGAAERQMQLTAPATPDAARWQGWGTALKPAWEPIIVARKPLDGTVAENVLRWGTGAINVDASRIPTNGDQKGQFGPHKPESLGVENTHGIYGRKFRQEADQSSGRWPANVIHDGSDEVLAGFPMTTSGGGQKTVNGPYTSDRTWNVSTTPGNDKHFEIDTGSAARFFYCAKASKSDRDEGLDELPLRGRNEVAGLNTATKCDPTLHTPEGVAARPQRHNHHPTVKPTALMRYLVRLVTPPGGVVLDPFMGSGSTGKAAVAEGFGFTGIDNEAEYAEIARRRIAAVQPPLGAV